MDIMVKEKGCKEIKTEIPYHSEVIEFLLARDILANKVYT